MESISLPVPLIIFSEKLNVSIKNYIQNVNISLLTLTFAFAGLIGGLHIFKEIRNNSQLLSASRLYNFALRQVRQVRIKQHLKSQN